jgi:hypothetical protein
MAENFFSSFTNDWKLVTGNSEQMFKQMIQFSNLAYAKLSLSFLCVLGG